MHVILLIHLLNFSKTPFIVQVLKCFLHLGWCCIQINNKNKNQGQLKRQLVSLDLLDVNHNDVFSVTKNKTSEKAVADWFQYKLEN